MRYDRGSRKCLKRYFSILLCSMFLLSVGTVASGRPFRLGKLPDKGKNFRCSTCHVNPRPDRVFTPFGSDYESIGLEAGDNYTEGLGRLDSDVDGFTNDQEFAAGTNPGDPQSRPGS